jgi:chromosome segregation ATPase
VGRLALVAAHTAEYRLLSIALHSLPRRFRDTEAMASEREADLIAYARSLEERDADIAARIDRTAELLRHVDDLRARAGRVREALAALPEVMTRREHAIAAAREREVEARREATEAERRLEEVSRSRRSGAEARAEAERALRRAAVAVADAVAAVARQEERLEAVASDQIALQADAEGLAVEAQVVAREVGGLPRLSESGRTPPGSTPAEIEEWGARAHSAIFVVRGGLETERERLVHEANLLAATRLGEHGGAASVSLVRRRLEQELG